MNIKKLEKYPVLHDGYIELHYIKQTFRLAILKMVPVKFYPYLLKREYKKRTGQDLNWDNLQTYNEKMQWDKLYNRDRRKTIFSDKYSVRSHIKEVCGGKYLVPIYGVWDDFDKIDFSTLPNRFVLKLNNGSSTNIIVTDKSKLDIQSARKKFKRWMKIDYSLLSGFEMQYKNILPKIIAEKYIEAPEGDLWDYKFLCFSGEPKYVWVDTGRYSKHKRNVYDLDWNLQPWNQFNYGNYEGIIEKPKNYEEMLSIVRALCKGFTHVRIDLYNVDGQIYFSEMTFTNGSGFEPIEPKEYNYMLGKLWDIGE